MLNVKPMAVRAAKRFVNARWFLNRAGSAADKRRRRQLLSAFRRVDQAGIGTHEERELLYMADQLLRLEPSGPLVECGCFLGGSTAKLSLVARELDRTLYVCDSFEGLPAPQGDGKVTSRFGNSYEFRQGEYASSLETTRANIARFGDVHRCVFVKGFFADTLPKLDVTPAFVFMDVDLVSSGRDCLRALWPRLRPGGLFFTHEACYYEYVRGITDARFWIDEVGEGPPPLAGAIVGVGFGAAEIAYFEKPQAS